MPTLQIAKIWKDKNNKYIKSRVENGRENRILKVKKKWIEIGINRYNEKRKREKTLQEKILGVNIKEIFGKRKKFKGKELQIKFKKREKMWGESFRREEKN